MSNILAPSLLLPVGANLHLKGEDSQLHFGSATLSARCARDSLPTVKYLGQQDIMFGQTSLVKVSLAGLPQCEAMTDVASPCVSIDPTYPPLFHCIWQGSEGAVYSKALAANRASSNQPQDLPYGVDSIECPVPSLEEMKSMFGSLSNELDAKAYVATISVKHFAPKTVRAQPTPRARCALSCSDR